MPDRLEEQQVTLQLLAVRYCRPRSEAPGRHPPNRSRAVHARERFPAALQPDHHAPEGVALARFECVHLKEHCLTRELSHRALSERAGVSSMTISHVERARVAPKLRSTRRIWKQEEQ